MSIKSTCLIALVITFCLAQVEAQEALHTNIQRLKQDLLIEDESYQNDTLIAAQTYYKTPINAISETIPQQLTDNEYAAEVDKKWLKELYSTTLFDTIYRAVEDLNYEAVYYPELPTDTLKARLNSLNAKTPFNVAYNPVLESVIKTFLKHRHQSFERLMGLSNFYFPMFEREFDQYDIPLEIKYLAIVESALKPKAKSRVGATGLWQFMFATGKQYGLEVSSYVDERCDPEKATASAAKYLAKLYELFNDWDLALAAYNSGPGNVTKAIRRSGGDQNYWNLRPFLPRETAGYLPAFFATMYIFEYAEAHGFIQHKSKFNAIDTDTIRVKQMITLDQVSEFTGVDKETLQFLNPSYKLDIIPYIEGKNYTLRLPRDLIGTVVNNEAQLYAYAKAEFDKREKPLPEFFITDVKTRYRVKEGDYLGKIAQKFGVRVNQIKQWNGLRSNNLKIGQRLTIYPRNGAAIKQATASNSNSSTLRNNKEKTYTVQKGDSLWSISQKFSGISIENIKEWNGISGTSLTPGMTLKLSKG